MLYYILNNKYQFILKIIEEKQELKGIILLITQF